MSDRGRIVELPRIDILASETAGELSDLRRKNIRPVGLFCADIHLRLRASKCRGENAEEWLACQVGVLKQIGTIRNSLASDDDQIGGRPPIYVAGDVFDRWNPPPELMNSLHGRFPLSVYTIPGQHDLPLHNLDDIGKSVYHTARLMGQITDIRVRGGSSGTSDAIIEAFPWGAELSKIVGRLKVQGKQIALCHAYCGGPGNLSYPDSSSKESVYQRAKSLIGYDLAVFGDNHKPFFWEPPAGENLPRVLNCGSLIRQKSDETHEPSVYSVWADGTVLRHPLDTSKDKNRTSDYRRESEGVDVSEALESYKDLIGGNFSADFEDAVRRAAVYMLKGMDEFRARTEDFLKEIIEQSRQLEDRK